MNPFLKQLKIFLGMNAVVAIIFGLGILFSAYFYPSISVATLIIVLGGYLLIEGAISMAVGIKNKWWSYSVAGFLSLALAIVIFFWPIPSILWLTLAFGVWAFMVGIVRIFESLLNQFKLKGRFLVAINGILSTMLGLLIIIYPEVGVVAFVFLLSLYFTLFGVVLLVYSLILDSLLEE